VISGQRRWTGLTAALLAVCFVLATAGCAVFSASVDSIKRSGITESDREELLQKQAKDFHSILSFGRVDAAASYLEDELKPVLLPKLTKALKTDKLVEHVIDDVHFTDASREATMMLTVKVFRNTDFLLRERALTEHWRFHTGGSWRLSSYEFTDRAH
jgi:hypothetical protein